MNMEGGEIGEDEHGADAIRYGGRYRVLRRLGSGGMATVFLGEDEVLGRQVALKRLRTETSEEEAGRFRREAQMAAMLNHPNVVKVYDTLVDEESVLIVMEYVAGTDLGERIKRGPLSGEETLGILRGVAAGLDHAHEQNLVHRDVKPSNILLGDRGETKLTDLGVAKAVQDTAVTRSGIVLGTPLYMAPEQLVGAPVTKSADIYALALIAVEMLSGERARGEGSIAQIAHKAVNVPAPDIRDAWPEAPEALAGVLDRALDRDPEGRPGSATELVGEIERGLKEETPIAAPVAVPPSQDEVSAPTTEFPGERPRERPAPPIPPATRRSAPGAPVRSGGRRWGRVLALVGLLAVALVVFLVISSGDSDDPGGTGASGETAQEGSGSSGTGSGADSSGSGEGSASDGSSGSGGGDTAEEPAEEPAAVAGDEAAAALQTFYEDAAADDFSGAYARATPNLQAQFGSSLGTFEGTFSTLESIEFTSLDTTTATADAAEVAFSTVATHTGFTDTCTGTAALVNDGQWLVDDLGVDCSRTEG